MVFSPNSFPTFSEPPFDENIYYLHTVLFSSNASAFLSLFLFFPFLRDVLGSSRSAKFS